MPSASAIRVARHRERNRGGVAVLMVEVDLIGLINFLTETRMLDPNMADDRDAITAAAQKLIEILVKEISQ